MKKYLLILTIIIIIILIGGNTMFSSFASSKGYVPDDGFIPNEATAIKIAEAVWLPIYGDSIYGKQPFVAEYNKKENCWIVVGTLPPNTLGGVPEIKISKSDGKIIYVYHGK